MKTPIQKLLDYTFDLLQTFDSEERVAMAVLDYIKNNKKAMLEEEKEFIKEIYWEGGQDVPQYSHSVDNWFNKTLNTKK